MTINTIDRIGFPIPVITYPTHSTLRTFSVGFGDCHLIYKAGGNESLTVDYGSKQTISSRVDSIYTGIFNKSWKNIALLTHYHLDHFKGFTGVLKSKNKYSLFYLPKLTPDSITGLNIIAIKIFTSILLPHNNSQFKLNSSRVEFINALAKSTKHIGFLSKGDKFKVNNEEYEVLWPEISTGIEVDLLISHVAVYEKMIELILNQFDISEDLNIFIKSLQKYSLSEGEFYDDNLEYKYLKLRRKIFENSDIHSMDIFKEMVSDIIKLNANTEKDLNKLSIVFHLKNRVLMTGDIPQNEFDNEIIPHLKLSEFYNVIKAPHHGTQSSFSLLIPKCETLIIPFSNYNKWQIDSSYNLQHQLGIFSKVYCTKFPKVNMNCKAYRIDKRCAGNCSISSYRDFTF